MGGRSSSRGCSQGWYHNWMPRKHFDNLSHEEYRTLVCDRVLQGKLQANNADMSVPPALPVGSSVSITKVQVPTPSTPDASSTVTGLPTYPASTILPHSVLMALVTPSPPLRCTTTSTQMDFGPNTLLQQLMLNASAHTPNTHGSVCPEDPSSVPICHTNHVAYCIMAQDCQASYPGAHMDSGANGRIAGFNNHLLATVPHVHVDITSSGGDIL